MNLVLLLPLLLSRAWALDTALIESKTGLKGKLDPESGVFKVQKPRDDLGLSVAGVALEPAMGVTSWAAFEEHEGHAMVMGDMVLGEGEVDRAMSAALDDGLEVTALHNHFLFDAPRVMFMHIHGAGEAGKLAEAVGAVMKVGGGSAPPPRALPAGPIDSKRLETVLGGKAESKDGRIFKFTFEKKTKMDGHELGKAMGVNTWAAFKGGDEDAVVDGDFAVLEGELQDALKTLRKADISVVAIHQHMTGETPRIMFLHYWGRGRAEELAKAIRSALGRR